MIKRFRDYFQGKKVTVMGLGLLGRGIGDTAFLAECGAELIVTDTKTEAELSSSLVELKQYPDIMYTLGEHTYRDFEHRDMILVAAGVPFDSPYLTHARQHGVPLKQSAALFTELTKIPVIGVTGTRGKSTVTHMIHHVLSHMTDGGEVLLGGNVRGVSNLQLLKEVQEDSIAVMELDSWQLQGFGWSALSPQIAVFTSFMEDHLNYYIRRNPSTTAAPSAAEYRAGMEAYFADKANIFRYQEGSDVLVTTRDVFERIESFAQSEGFELIQDIRLTDTSVLPHDMLLSMPGEHNRLNAALAVEALRATGLTDEEIFEGLASFPGVPGRLEYLGEKNGVKIFNDNNATTPTATRAGIEAVSGGPACRDEHGAGRKNVILIMGGSGKGLDMKPLLEVIPLHCKTAILIPGSGTDELIKTSDNLPFECKVVRGISGEEVLRNAMETALKVAVSGDAILFSPAFASFGMFKNEYDRGDQFTALATEAFNNEEG